MLPSGSDEPEALAVTVTGSLPVAGEALRAGTGGWFGDRTVIAVLAAPERAFVAVYVAACGPMSAVVGVHVSRPVVLPAPVENTAPGRALTTSDAMASPSGSEAVMLSASEAPAWTLAVAGAKTTGARSGRVTLMRVVAHPDRVVVAVNVMSYVPACASTGVQLRAPVALPAAGVNVAPDGNGAAVRELMLPWLGSVAVTLTVNGLPAATLASAGAVTTGAPLAVTLTMVVAAPESELAAVNVTAYLPLWPEAGVQLNVPLVRLAFAENVAPDGSPEATSDAMVWPSGSVKVHGSTHSE